jgi:hypothetical protein
MSSWTWEYWVIRVGVPALISSMIVLLFQLVILPKWEERRRGGYRFTRRTYRAALKRALAREIQAFEDHNRGIRGPDKWYELMPVTDAIRDRRARETGKDSWREITHRYQ